MYAGPVGMAAAAAIASSKKRKRPHSFETNPSVRKRHQNRLLRKLRVSEGRATSPLPIRSGLTRDFKMKPIYSWTDRIRINKRFFFCKLN